MGKQIPFEQHPTDKSIIYVNGIELRESNPELGLKRHTYYCSADGEVYSMNSFRFLHPTNDASGYKCANLKAEGGGKKRYGIAKVILATWKGMYPVDMEDPTVEHIDGDRQNNHISNLMWLTRSDNSKNRHFTVCGSDHKFAKLTEEQVIEICNILQYSKISVRRIAEMYHVSRYAVEDIVIGKNWKQISKDYDFKHRKLVRGIKEYEKYPDLLTPLQFQKMCGIDYNERRRLIRHNRIFWFKIGDTHRRRIPKWVAYNYIKNKK